MNILKNSLILTSFAIISPLSSSDEPTHSDLSVTAPQTMSAKQRAQKQRANERKQPTDRHVLTPRTPSPSPVSPNLQDKAVPPALSRNSSDWDMLEPAQDLEE